jgi:hypothetical protein
MLLEQGGSEKRQKIVKAHLLQRPSQVHCFMLLREYWQPLTSGWLLLHSFRRTIVQYTFSDGGGVRPTTEGHIDNILNFTFSISWRFRLMSFQTLCVPFYFGTLA